MATAFIRAVHVHVDDAPPVCDDQVAFDLLPGYQRRFIRRLQALSKPWLGRYRQRRDAFTAMRAHVVVRARYAEDSLSEARKTTNRAVGADRYVILAAGLDTFALRQSEPAVDVVEIDHPATQRWKRQLLARRGITPPDHLTFLPIDFEQQSITDVWIDNVRPDFISWLGTTYYLTRDAIANTLTALAALTRPGSQLVLDYWREPPPTDPGSWILWGTRIAVAAQQEPMRSFFEPREIEALAQSTGWQVRKNWLPEEQNARYLTDRKDGLAAPSFACLLHLER